MNCTEFRKNYENRDAEPFDFEVHTASCENCESFVQAENELTSALKAITKKTPPATFGTDVRSGIALGRSSTSHWLRAARIAVPAAAMLLIVGFVITRSDLFGPAANHTEIRIAQENSPSTTASESKSAAVNHTDDLRVAEEPAVQQSNVSVAKNQDTELAVDDKPDKETVEVKEPKSDRRSSDSVVAGSIDLASEAPEVTNPPGIDPDRPVSSNPNGPKEVFSTMEVLGSLGISAQWKNSKLVVVSVVDKSIAEKSGILEGDQIIAIDGKSISRKSVSSGNVSGRKLRIIRKGVGLDISIGNK